MELGDSRQDWQRIEVAPREQSAAYCPGNGNVLFLHDRTTRADLFNLLTEVECRVLEARLVAWAELASGAANAHSEAAR